ncbi:hypothetical protein GBP346_B0122 [Burkholderia pseudomallei MSHR346]|nr:hypothetical protein GBP346_B0122 [Burkholderia pseudomallei MSHR346]
MRCVPRCAPAAALAFAAAAPGISKPRRTGRRRGILGVADATGASADARRSIMRNVSGSYKVGASVSPVRAKSLFSLIFGFHID